MTLLPAVDVADGQAVRLVQGAAGTETGYGDPLAAALAWQRAGAEWVHLVDLDAAFGRGSNAALLAEVVGRSSTSRSNCPAASATTTSLAAALATGCARVNLGTAALERPGLGARPSSPSTATGSPSAWTCAGPGSPRAAGPGTAATWSRCWPGWTADGCAPVRGHRRHQGRHAGRAQPRTCSGRCARGTARPVIASGGVSSLDDLRAIAALAPLGVEGAIVGKALYAGAFTLEQALEAVAA